VRPPPPRDAAAPRSPFVAPAEDVSAYRQGFAALEARQLPLARSLLTTALLSPLPDPAPTAPPRRRCWMGVRAERLRNSGPNDINTNCFPQSKFLAAAHEMFHLFN